MKTYKTPESTADILYLESEWTYTLNDLLARAQEKWGEDINFDAIDVSYQCLRTTHHDTYAYYEHDPDDYENFIVLKKIR